MDQHTSQDAFTVERHGEITLIEASPSLERLDVAVAEQVADLLLDPLRDQEVPLVIVDLSRVDYFGSIFLALLIRCWKLASVKGGQLVLVGPSERARELLRLTSLDLVWPIYTTRSQAVEALLAD